MSIHIRGDVTVGWVAAFLAMIIITLITIVANTVMLIAVRRAKRAPAHFALRSLLAADLLVGLCVLPVAAARELFVFHLPWFLCACWSTFDVLCCTASILSLCALGWERWSGITAPFGLSRRARIVKLLVALLWPASIAIALPTGFIPSPRHYNSKEIPKACTVNINVGYVFSSVTCSFYVPTIVMLVFYWLIVRSLAISPNIRAHRGKTPTKQELKENNDENQKVEIKSLHLDQPEGQNKKCVLCLSPKRAHLALPSPLRAISPVKSATTLSSMIPRQRRATQAIIMLMSLFLLCWSPFFIMLPMDSICNCVGDTTWQWCTWLGYANSALNPLVYAAASPSVRRALPASIPLTTSSKSTEMTYVK
ncbi:hypothetical protein O0L34_g12734 [Tuta absoluta]|nr:hypothetical protein O0L34_g12734 [Tuta absoluta]